MMCFRYTKLLVPYSEGGLDARMRARVKRHLEVCKNCAADLRAIQSVGQALTRSDNFATEPAPDLWAKVNARITSRPVRRHPTARSWALRIASAAAAAVLMAVVASSIMRPHLPAKSQMALVRHVIPRRTGRSPDYITCRTTGAGATPAQARWADAQGTTGPADNRSCGCKTRCQEGSAAGSGRHGVARHSRPHSGPAPRDNCSAPNHS